MNATTQPLRSTALSRPIEDSTEPQGITPERLAALADIIERHGLTEQTVAVIRSVNADLRVTLCNEDDITAGRPVLKRGSFHVYLVGGQSHCLTLTADYDAAIGIVLAEFDPPS